MKIKRVYTCLYSSVYLLGLPTKLFLILFLLCLVLIFIVRTSVLITLAIFVFLHLVLSALYKKSPNWFAEFLFFLQLPYKSVTDNKSAYLPPSDEVMKK